MFSLNFKISTHLYLVITQEYAPFLDIRKYLNVVLVLPDFFFVYHVWVIVWVGVFIIYIKKSKIALQKLIVLFHYNK